jgi:diguanylate cyclase (GGDEF)-like protein
MTTQTDSLTDLPGKVDFDRRVASCITEGEDAGSAKGPVSVAFLDVDHFLAVNEQHGREEGDAVLVALAETFAARFADDGSGTFRIGGDEFAVLMPGIEKEDAFLRLEEARSAFVGLETLRRIEPGPTISVGIATYPDDGATRQEVLRKADDALFRAKSTGRNRVTLAREEKKIPKTSHYTQGQLERLAALAGKEGIGEAELLREALDDLLKKYSS